MNVFYIPSWYVGGMRNPTRGIFFQEQAEALADNIPGLTIAISLWGQENTLSHMMFKPTALAGYAVESMLGRTTCTWLKNNLLAIRTPRFQIANDYLYKVNIDGIIRANIKNLGLFAAQRGKVDLIHAHVAYRGGFVAAALSQKFRIPYIVTEHMNPFPFRVYLDDNQLMDIIREPLQNCPKIIAVSESLKNDMSGYGIKNVVVIPNVISDSYFVPELKRREGGFVLTLGAMTREKGIRDLLLAIPRVLESNERLEFRIAGGVPPREFVKLCSELHIENNVRWLGMLSRADVLYQMQHADCFVLPSHRETFGVVYLEAISCGTPVIATRCGGPEDIVTEKNGRLVDVGDVDGLSEAILDVLRLRLDRRKIREDFEIRFSTMSITNRIYQIYNEVVNNYHVE